MKINGILLTAFLLALVAGTAFAADRPGTRPGTQSFDLFPAGKEKGGAPITLSFQGTLYDAGWTLDQRARFDEAEAFVARVVAANREGSAEDIVALWSPAEREAIRAEVGKDELYRKNRERYQALTSSAFLARMEYGAYTLFFVRHLGPSIDFVNIYPLKRVDGRLHLTNDLKSDNGFRYLFLAFRDRLAAAGKP